MQGLVIENSADLYKVEVQNKIYTAQARGKLKNDGNTLAVGDFVNITITNENNSKAVIDEICKRNVYIKRPKLANITQLVLVISSKNPKPDLLMLDKQLAFAEYLKIKAIIVLNKIDLDDEKKFEGIKKIYEDIGYSVIMTQANCSKGIEQLKEKLLNNINAFSGNSGVGKSTLINHIFSYNITEEGEISKKNKRGKNTTTISKLYKIDENTYIADTPGFSTFSIEEIERKDLEKYFIEINENKGLCEFVGCSHIKEEECNIKKLIKYGKISESRYKNFCKIYEELKQKEERKW